MVRVMGKSLRCVLKCGFILLELDLALGSVAVDHTKQLMVTLINVSQASSVAINGPVIFEG